MKKLIALVLAFAMLVTVFTFSASAEAAAPVLSLEGAATAGVGETYTVAIRLEDADNTVGGFQGELVYEGARVTKIEANPIVFGFNKAEEADLGTIIKDDNNSVNFATVADLNGVNPETRIWFIVTFEITADARFTLENVVVSNKEAASISGTFGDVLDPVLPAAGVKLLGVGALKEAKAVDQALVVNGQITDTDVVEFGVIYYPTQLLEAPLTLETKGAIVAKLSSGNAAFEKNLNAAKTGEGFESSLVVNYTAELNAAKFLGIKISSVVYYEKADGSVVYSENNVDKYIQGGVASKAILNVVVDYAAKNGVEIPSNSELNDVDNMVANRNKALAAVVAHMNATPEQ